MGLPTASLLGPPPAELVERGGLCGKIPALKLPRGIGDAGRVVAKALFPIVVPWGGQEVDALAKQLPPRHEGVLCAERVLRVAADPWKMRGVRGGFAQRKRGVSNNGNEGYGSGPETRICSLMKSTAY